MDKPLTTWYCDSCGGPITDLTQSLLTWDTDDTGRATEFRIVHKSMGGRQCDPYRAPSPRFTSSNELSNYVGADGLAALLSFLSAGPLIGKTASFPRVADFDQFVDVVRRLQTPWYEEARSHFAEEEVRDALEDASETLPYLSDVLRRIVTGTL